MSAVRQTSWPQVLAWRMQQQWVEPPGEAGVVDIVRRLCGVQAQVLGSSAHAVAVRQASPAEGAVDKALADKTLMRTWGVRGTLHLLAPDEAGAYLSLVAAARSWEKKVWEKTFGVSPSGMEQLVEVVGEVLDGEVLTRDELVAAVGDELGHGELEEQLRSGWGTVLKPIAWQGMLCHGPAAGNRVTFARPSSYLPDWGGIPAPEEAAAVAVPAYLRAYGPASPTTFDAWLIRGVSKKAMLRGWFSSLGDALAEVEIDGEPGPLYMRAEDVDALAATKSATSVRLLPAFDQYVLGPGTNAEALIPKAHRKDVSRAGGWITPVVLQDGRVVGTWETADDGSVEVSLFDPTTKLPAEALAAERKRLAALVG